MTNLSERLPPHNLEAELGVLCCLVLDPQCRDDVTPLLGAGDFYRDIHQVLYRVIREMLDSGRPLDAILLDEELNRRGLAGKVGADETLVDALRGPAIVENATFYAHLVRQKATAREVIEVANGMLRDGYSNSYSADELKERTEKSVFAMSATRSESALCCASEAVEDSLYRMGLRDEGVKPGLATGFHDFDNLTGGLHPGHLVVVAARPSIGKSTWSLNVAEHVAMGGTGVLFVSLEMGRGELGDRMICGRAGIDGERYMHSMRLLDADREAIRDAAEELAAIPLHIDDAPSQTVARVASTARKLRVRAGADRLGLVVVDYLQLVTPEGNRGSPRHEQVAAMSAGFKRLAMEIGVPVIMVCQLNREVERREDRRPSISDLRESGAIEQDANVVLLLHRPEFYDPTERPGEADLIIAKNRSGPTGKVRLTFVKQTTRFSSFARER